MLCAIKTQVILILQHLSLYDVQRKGKTIQNLIFGFRARLGISQKVPCSPSKGQKTTFLFVQVGV